MQLNPETLPNDILKVNITKISKISYGFKKLTFNSFKCTHVCKIIIQNGDGHRIILFVSSESCKT